MQTENAYDLFKLFQFCVFFVHFMWVMSVFWLFVCHLIVSTSIITI